MISALRQYYENPKLQLKWIPTFMMAADELTKHVILGLVAAFFGGRMIDAQKAQAESKGGKTYAQPQSLVCQRLLAAYFLGNIPTVHAAQFTIEVSTMDMITIALTSLLVVGVAIWRGWKKLKAYFTFTPANQAHESSDLDSASASSWEETLSKEELTNFSKEEAPQPQWPSTFGPVVRPSSSNSGVQTDRVQRPTSAAKEIQTMAGLTTTTDACVQSQTTYTS